MHEITDIKYLPKECMFFGYGSLMYPEGINGRGMRYKYLSQDELTPISIAGLKRSMSAEYVSAYSSNTSRFYGVSPNPQHSVFGVVFKIYSLHDLMALLKSEYCNLTTHNNPVYKLYDISDKVDIKIEKPVFTLVCEELEDQPEKYYPNYVKSVFKSLPKALRMPFLATGGLKSEIDCPSIKRNCQKQ